MGFFSWLFGSKKNSIDESFAKACVKAKDDIDESFVEACLETPDLVLRAQNEKTYDAIWKLATAKGRWTDRECIELANIGTLKALNEVETAFKLSSDELNEISQWESSPFNRLPHNLAKTALIEYIVWRQYPDKADIKALMIAINDLLTTLQTSDGKELLDRFRNSPDFAWLPWRKLIV